MSDEYYTPQWIFEKLGVIFDIDVASDGGIYSHCPAKLHYTIKENGLIQPWQGLVWMNPPYSKPKPWVEKWLDHNNGIALLPFAKSSWFLTLWDSHADIIPLPVNLKFDTPQGATKPIMMQTLLTAVGQEAKILMKRINVARIRS